MLPIAFKLTSHFDSYLNFYESKLDGVSLKSNCLEYGDRKTRGNIM